VVHGPIDTAALNGGDPRALAERVRLAIAPDAESDLDVSPPDTARPADRERRAVSGEPA